MIKINFSTYVSLVSVNMVYAFQCTSVVHNMLTIFPLFEEKLMSDRKYFKI